MRRVLVTGAGGQLGMTLQDLAIDYPQIHFDFKDSKELDITNSENLRKIFSRTTYDFCVNCAAYTDVEQAEKTPANAFIVNAEAVKSLALLCKKSNVILIHISTDYVFDGEKKTPYLPNDRTRPINKYGKSKLRGEEYVQKLLPLHYIIRTSWLYSKKYGNNFYRSVLKKALEKEELRITDSQTGCPTNTENFSKFILEEIIIGKKPYGTYHYSDEEPMTWYDFAKKILEENDLMKSASLVLDTNYRTFAQRPKNSTLSPD